VKNLNLPQWKAGSQNRKAKQVRKRMPTSERLMKRGGVTLPDTDLISPWKIKLTYHFTINIGLINTLYRIHKGLLKVHRHFVSFWGVGLEIGRLRPLFQAPCSNSGGVKSYFEKAVSKTTRIRPLLMIHSKGKCV
jgi:hypothetical protein